MRFQVVPQAPSGPHGNPGIPTSGPNIAFQEQKINSCRAAGWTPTADCPAGRTGPSGQSLSIAAWVRKFRRFQWTCKQEAADSTPAAFT